MKQKQAGAGVMRVPHYHLGTTPAQRVRHSPIVCLCPLRRERERERSGGGGGGQQSGAAVGGSGGGAGGALPALALGAGGGNGGGSGGGGLSAVEQGRLRCLLQVRVAWVPGLGAGPGPYP
jgi:hypothetical protein